jgi:FkbM family methyltransferase
MMREDHPIVRALVLYGTRLKHPGQERVHSWLRARLRVDVNSACDVERAGLRWRLNPHDYTQRSLFWFGERDRWDFHHFARLARPGATVIDVGANFGYYSVALASRLQGQCRIYAFEPFPRTFDLLKHHIQVNGFNGVITPLDVALSDEPGTAVINEWPGAENSGAASLATGPDSKGVVLAPSTTVAVNTLDAAVAQLAIARLDLMKIDVEGFEERVLRGGEGTLRELRPAILIEFHRRALGRAGSSPERLQEVLGTAGYSLHRVAGAELAPLTVLPADGEFVNVFALPGDRAP